MTLSDLASIAAIVSALLAILGSVLALLMKTSRLESERAITTMIETKIAELKAEIGKELSSGSEHMKRLDASVVDLQRQVDRLPCQNGLPQCKAGQP